MWLVALDDENTGTNLLSCYQNGVTGSAGIAPNSIKWIGRAVVICCALIPHGCTQSDRDNGKSILQSVQRNNL